jgi:hypothetical protein
MAARNVAALVAPVVIAVIALLVLYMLRRRMQSPLPSWISIGIGALLVLWGAALLAGWPPPLRQRGEFGESSDNLASQARALNENLDEWAGQNKPDGEAGRKLHGLQDQAARLQDEARKVVILADHAELTCRGLAGLLLECMGWFAIQAGRRSRGIAAGAAGKEKGLR